MSKWVPTLSTLGKSFIDIFCYTWMNLEDGEDGKFLLEDGTELVLE